MRYAIILTVVVIVVVSVTFALSSNSAQNEIENPMNVKITNSSIADGYGNPVGVTCDRWFSVTIQNKGETSVSGLTMDFKIFINDTEFDGYDIAYLETSTFVRNCTLKPQETSEFQGTVLGPMNGPLFFGRNPADEIFIQVKLKTNETLLDEIKITFDVGHFL
jgi:hypothetical protein